MNSITVCVDYSDLLALTLPQNCRHFDRSIIITSPDDKETMRVAASCNHGSDIQLHVTDAFYRYNCPFNKGRVLHDIVAGLSGWVCHIDADTMLPPDAAFDELDPTCIYSAYRKMLRNPSDYTPETDWNTLPDGPEKTNGEYAGYIQCWHTSAGHEYPTEWIHAGGSDSFFYQKWPPPYRRRLPFTVLHLGVDGMNWCGRVTPMLDGTVPEEARRREDMLRMMKLARNLTKTYDAEKLHG